MADGHHARTDALTSLDVLVGAGGVALGWQWADPVIGLVITVAILMVLRTASGEVFRRPMDAVDPELVDRAEEVLAATPGVVGVQRVRLRWIGHEIQADADLTLDPQATLSEAHAIAHHAEAVLIGSVTRLSSAVVHAYPAPDTAST